MRPRVLGLTVLDHVIAYWNASGSSGFARHFPIVGSIFAILILWQIIRQEAIFGFPGEPHFERKYQPITYWTLIAIEALGGLVISYFEIRHGT